MRAGRPVSRTTEPRLGAVTGVRRPIGSGLSDVVLPARIVTVSSDSYRTTNAPSTAEQTADFVRHRGKDVGRRRPRRDQHGHPTQGGLLIRDRTQLLACLSIRDRGGHEFGEPRETFLGSGWWWLLARRYDGNEAPQLALDGDRHAPLRNGCPFLAQPGRPRRCTGPPEPGAWFRGRLRSRCR